METPLSYWELTKFTKWAHYFSRFLLIYHSESKIGFKDGIFTNSEIAGM